MASRLACVVWLALRGLRVGFQFFHIVLLIGMIVDRAG